MSKKHIDWNGKKEIFKAQLSFSNGLSHQTIFLYNKDRSVMTEIKADNDMLKMFRGDMKIYVIVTYIKDPSIPNAYKLSVGSRVMDRDW